MKKTTEKFGIESLTQREKETLRYLVYGLTNKQIAQQMNVSYHTIKAFVASLLDKLGSERRSDLIVKALLYNIVEVDPKDFE